MALPSSLSLAFDFRFFFRGWRGKKENRIFFVFFRSLFVDLVSFFGHDPTERCGDMNSMGGEEGGDVQCMHTFHNVSLGLIDAVNRYTEMMFILTAKKVSDKVLECFDYPKLFFA